jgi:hypothetical protein
MFHLGNKMASLDQVHKFSYKKGIQYGSEAKLLVHRIIDDEDAGDDYDIAE